MGRSIADRFAAAGAKVVLWGRHLRRYGRLVPPDTLYFTGIHHVGEICAESGQSLSHSGYAAGAATFNATGQVELIDGKEQISASWSIAKLLEHRGRKHALAFMCIPSRARIGRTANWILSGFASAIVSWARLGSAACCSLGIRGK
jgi:NAD(P)-dependent dehydrogenase (short-subunit alcohol dehydrogenase family)